MRTVDAVHVHELQAIEAAAAAGAGAGGIFSAVSGGSSDLKTN